MFQSYTGPLRFCLQEELLTAQPGFLLACRGGRLAAFRYIPKVPQCVPDSDDPPGGGWARRALGAQVKRGQESSMGAPCNFWSEQKREKKGVSWLVGKSSFM